MNCILVVIYNKECNNSDTIKSIIRTDIFSRFSVIVFDNSTIDTGNKEFCERHNIIYYGFNENWGLSRAYNYVIERLPEGTEHLMIFDDDTSIPYKYFLNSFNYLHEGTADVYLPIVKESDTKRILSPLNSTKHKSGFQRLHTIEDLDYHRITAINTGMIINTEVYKKIKYDENLFLDCVDHDFMTEVRKHGYSIKVMDCELLQHYSRNEQTDSEAALRRFIIYKKDFAFYSKKHGNRYGSRISLLLHKIKSAVRYRKLDFIRAGRGS